MTTILTRRRLLTCTLAVGGLAGAWAAGLSPAWAQAAPAAGTATQFVVDLGNRLVQIVNGPGDYESKKRALEPLIEQAVDVNGIGQFCLGRFWRIATPAQQQAYLSLFHQVLLNNITGKIGQFQGVTFAPTQTVQRDNEALVGTLIKRPNQEANNVQWVVEQVGGQPKIVDVVAEGTSLRLTQRSDYASYLSRNGNNVDALIAAMRQQLSR